MLDLVIHDLSRSKSFLTYIPMDNFYPCFYNNPKETLLASILNYIDVEQTVIVYIFDYNTQTNSQISQPYTKLYDLIDY